MKNLIKMLIAVIFVILAVVIVVSNYKSKKVVEVPVSLTPTSGTYCYGRTQIATTDEPYNVTEHLSLTFNGDTISGTKIGNQSGPDMTNGYDGVLTGKVNGSNLELNYAYMVEGSKNNELEIYTLNGEQLFKKRWVLVDKVIDGSHILVPDGIGEPKIISYNKDNCQDVVTIKPIELCFYNETKNSRNLYDVSLLKLNITGDKVSGQFRNIPAEKDSKVGAFEGSVGPVDKTAMARTVDAWWNSEAEGMKVKEQLKIVFGEGSAQVAFGEMVDRGDGVYIYKDPTKLKYGVSMSDTTCSDVDDHLIVERYIKDNIKTLAPAKAVLGGSWYTTLVRINPVTKTGNMTYEDGHIQGKATFSYIRSGQTVSITDIKKIK